jgi:hypothetical protein
MTLHHIGYIVKDIESYEKNLLYEEKVKEVVDPVQNSKLSLYKNFSTCFIELIQPLNEQSYNYAFLEKFGEQYHHLCYAVKSADVISEIARNMKLIFIKGPMPAILFDNNEVFFYYTRNKMIIEFLIQ